MKTEKGEKIETDINLKIKDGIDDLSFSIAFVEAMTNTGSGKYN